MTIKGFPEDDTDEFGKALKKVVSPARPIHSFEYLKGRETEVAILREGLCADGRQAFIYGDRGVGKSSLAATVAYYLQSSSAEPLFVQASKDSTFKNIIANIANKAINRSRTDTVKRSTSTHLEWRGLNFGTGSEVTPLDIATQINSVSDATELLHQLSQRLAELPVIVLDEFDTIGEPRERHKFAELLKQLGDQHTEIKLIFTGVGASLQELLGAHASAYRQLIAIPLARLGWEGRREIVERAVESFSLSIDENVNWRIAIISHGFPYYVHLIAEHMLWDAFKDHKEVGELTWEHYRRGLQSAIRTIDAKLRDPYDKAVTLRGPEFEDVVWSTADGEEDYLSINAMYNSYLVVTEKRGSATVLDRPTYTDYLRKLRTPAYGKILQSVVGRPGWYVYTEHLLRGFVRMQAEANAVELTGGRPSPRPQIHVPNARTGIFGPSVPTGVRLRGRREDKDDDG